MIRNSSKTQAKSVVLHLDGFTKLLSVGFRRDLFWSGLNFCTYIVSILKFVVVKIKDKYVGYVI